MDYDLMSAMIDNNTSIIESTTLISSSLSAGENILQDSVLLPVSCLFPKFSFPTVVRM
jgi:hypothetical protein